MKTKFSFQVRRIAREREREREIDRETDRQTERQTDRQTETDTQRETDRETDRDRQRQRQRQISMRREWFYFSKTMIRDNKCWQVGHSLLLTFTNHHPTLSKIAM